MSEAPKGPSVPVPVAREQLAPGPQRELLLQGTNNEEDRNPYSVHGDPLTRTCPGCSKAIPERASVCAHCGLDFKAQDKPKRVFEPVDRTWEYGWPLRRRLTVFLVLQGLTLAAVSILLATGQSAGLSVSALLVGAVVQAFLLGSYDRLQLTRTASGKVVLTCAWRVAFVALAPSTVRWKEHEGVRLVVNDRIETMDIIFTAIFLGAGIVPGILFWCFCVASDRFDVTLCKDHGHASTVVFRSQNQQRAQGVLQTISDITTLPVLN